jgi:DNA-directed RNA polymerase subunit RPC12/RpoP
MVTDPMQECGSCGEEFNALEDDHYQITKEERPVKDLEEREFDDWFVSTWYVCQECVGRVLAINPD